ncbi:MAG TPA: hypothetical protein PKH77_22000 [Anaerolineae bacterium]|nr:hypothetical protein [Anaerolineae bacterium]
MASVIALNTKPVTDWRSVWQGLGQSGLERYYTPGTPAIKLRIV